MLTPTSDLRYDPNDDDSAPGRSPAGLLALLTEAALAASGAHSAIDVYETVCRALAEGGVTAAVLTPHAGPDRFAMLAHRLGVSPTVPPAAPGLDAALGGPLAYGPGAHPLCAELPPDGGLSFPSVVASFVPGADAEPVILSLFAPDIGPEHRPVAKAFAVMIGGLVSRITAEARLREAHARVEQRLRSRAEELTGLHELSLGLFRATDELEGARLTAAAAAAIMRCDVAGVVLCVDGRHSAVVAGHAGEPAAGLLRWLGARMNESLAALAGRDHVSCRAGGVEMAGPASGGRPASGVIIDGPPAALLEAPIMDAGTVSGLVALGALRATAFSPDQVRMLYALAGQLGTAIERTRAARTAAGDRTAALLEGLDDGVLLLSAVGRIIASNERGRQMLRTLGGAVEDADVPASIAMLVAAALRDDARVTRAVETAAHTPRSIVATVTPVVGGLGEPAGALMLHGTTDAELMRERLFQSEKMASVGRLVSGVAHELNNPLTGIMGFAQLLLLRDLDPAARHEAETIRAEAERASKIVQNLLSFARRRSPERVPVDLNALIERVLSLWEYDLRVRDIVVRRDLGPGAPLIEADAHQIQQLLLNVLTNAAQALRAAGGGGAITVSTHAAGGYVRTHISDNGPGIAPDHLRRIFDPFFTTKPVGEGTGLGLTICYGIVEEHQGRITVESAPGQGATVVIDLPVAASTSLEQPALEPSTPQGPSRSILVVDDEPAIIDLLDGALTLDGHRVDRSTSAQAALERVCPGAYDAVITDVRMPGMDGIAFYRWLVERDPGLVGRVIFTSGDTVNSETRAFVEAGSMPFLAKPFTLQELRDMVDDVLGGRKDASPAAVRADG